MAGRVLILKQDAGDVYWEATTEAQMAGALVKCFEYLDAQGSYEGLGGNEDRIKELEALKVNLEKGGCIPPALVRDAERKVKGLELLKLREKADERQRKLVATVRTKGLSLYARAEAASRLFMARADYEDERTRVVILRDPLQVEDVASGA